MLYNNQDAYRVHHEEGFIVAVVCDGCGSSVASETGSKLTAEFVVNYCVQNFRSSFSGEVLLDAILGFYKQCALQVLSTDPARFIEDHFYTTIVGCIISDTGTVLFSAGDGVIVVDEEIELIDQQNIPQYLAYHLTQQKQVEFKVRVLPGNKITRLLIATDGLEDLWNEGEEEKAIKALFSKEHFRSDVALEKYLCKQENLSDDTTVVMISL